MELAMTDIQRFHMDVMNHQLVLDNYLPFLESSDFSLFSFSSADLMVTLELFGPYFSSDFYDVNSYITNQIDYLLVSLGNTYSYNDLYNLFLPLQQSYKLFNTDVGLIDETYFLVNLVDDNLAMDSMVAYDKHDVFNLLDVYVYRIIDYYYGGDVSHLELKDLIENTNFIDVLTYKIKQGLFSDNGSFYFNNKFKLMLTDYSITRKNMVIDIRNVLLSNGYRLNGDLMSKYIMNNKKITFDLIADCILSKQ